MIRPKTCPICDKPVPPDDTESESFLPFCSQRCREVDLLRWTNGTYAIREDIPPELLDPELFDPDLLDVDGYDPERDGP